MLDKISSRKAIQYLQYDSASKKQLIDSLLKHRQKEKTAFHARPYGPHGWMDIFIGDCFLYPVNALLTFVIVGTKADTPFHTLYILIFLTDFLVFGYLALKAGWSLRRIWPQAITWTKNFLVLSTAWALALAFISLDLGYIDRQVSYYYQNRAVIVICNFILWSSYLALSKRVKNTYTNH